MIVYKVTQKIKLHTQPPRVIVVEREGVFVKETEKSYIFKDFRVQKSTVIKIEEVHDGN